MTNKFDLQYVYHEFPVTIHVSECSFLYGRKIKILVTNTQYNAFKTISLIECSIDSIVKFRNTHNRYVIDKYSCCVSTFTTVVYVMCACNKTHGRPTGPLTPA